MRFAVVRSDVADAEIDAAVFWMVGRSLRRANDWYAGLRKAIDTLEEMPTRCPIANETEHLGVTVRQLRYRDHRILFRLADSDGDGTEDTVIVLHVQHLSRGPLYPLDIED